MILSVFREVCIPISNMSAGLKTSSIILLFVVLVCGQVLADSKPTLSMTTDEPVSVVTVRSQSSTSSSGIKHCLVTKSAVPSFKVRFQKLKGKSATFTRTLLKRKIIQTYATGIKVVSMTNIAHCVKLADAEGFDGFSFNGGTCDLFNMDFQTCGCVTGAKDVFYVQASFWATKDWAIPQMVSNAGMDIAVVHLPGSVYDKYHIFGDRITYSNSTHATSLDEQLQLSCSKSYTARESCVCTGNECSQASVFDTQHCVPKSCNATGNTTVVQSEPVDFENFYLLSECGKTITLEPLAGLGGRRKLRLLSHKGFGCQWYPKNGRNEDCVVTISSGNRTSLTTYSGYSIVLDGNTTTCEGDSLSIYEGAPSNSSLKTTWNACNVSSFGHPTKMSAEIPTIVFKRTARQYQEDGFNFGFFLQWAMTIDM